MWGEKKGEENKCSIILRFQKKVLILILLALHENIEVIIKLFLKHLLSRSLGSEQYLHPRPFTPFRIINYFGRVQQKLKIDHKKKK